jgi:hypothetical protein
MKLTQDRCRLLTFAMLLASCGFSASAGVLEYTNQTAFLSATSNLTTINFEGIENQGGSDQDERSGLTLDLVQFTGNENNGSCPNNCFLEVENPGTVPNPGAFQSWGSGSYLVGPTDFSTDVSGIHVLLPAGIYAVGANVMSGGGGSSFADTEDIFLTTTSGTTSYSIATTAGFSNMAFVGFVSTAPITSIFFDPLSVSDHVVIDNFSFGQGASAAPETSTSLLCGGGLLLLARFLGRRRMPSARD